MCYLRLGLRLVLEVSTPNTAIRVRFSIGILRSQVSSYVHKKNAFKKKKTYRRRL
jgi:hypothetical protein